MFKDGDKVAFINMPHVLLGTVDCATGNTCQIVRTDGKAHWVFRDNGLSHRDADLARWPQVVKYVERAKEDLFFVFNPQGGPPRVPHSTHESACKEAERLAKLQPAHKFYVLKAVDEFSATVTINHEAL